MGRAARQAWLDTQTEAAMLYLDIPPERLTADCETAARQLRSGQLLALALPAATLNAARQALTAAFTIEALQLAGGDLLILAKRS